MATHGSRGRLLRSVKTPRNSYQQRTAALPATGRLVCPRVAPWVGGPCTRFEADPTFPNLLHWRRHQAPGLCCGFGGGPEAMGPARLATTNAPPKAEWRGLANGLFSRTMSRSGELTPRYTIYLPGSGVR
jgi:hypothetical protein